MLTLLIPFIALLARAQAADLKSSVTIEFNSDLKLDYWTDTTSYAKDEKPELSLASDGVALGSMVFFKTEDVREFHWKQKGDNKKEDVVSFHPRKSRSSLLTGKQCHIWLDQDPESKKFAYVLEPDKKDTVKNIERDKTDEGNTFKITCDGDADPIPIPTSSGPRLNPVIRPSETIVSEAPSGTPYPPPFAKAVTVNFFANPDSLYQPPGDNAEQVPWWVDQSPPVDKYGDQTDKIINGVVVPDHADGSKGLGQMSISHLAERLYLWQSKKEGPDDKVVHIQVSMLCYSRAK
jgi:hypothetical protein